ncbi:amidohydrolase family protein [Elongatibacter sediminis]|uniref:Amidohydrolase family protein n=1 Tax=Elongatibacter sediminis TaxID=3119006 RepID=A0AAW9R4H3_9GAMM
MTRQHRRTPTHVLKHRAARHCALALSGLLFAAPAPAADADRPADLVLRHCLVFTGLSETLEPDRSVYIRDGRIEAITDSSQAAPPAGQTIDCAGHTLVPGLIDAHTHLDNLEQAARALASGTTTVRTAGVPAYQDVGLKALAATGRIAGPDVIAAGVYVTPGLEESILADPRLAPLANGVRTEDELRLLVRINAERGADVIKTRGTERAGRPDTDPREQVYTQAQLEIVVDEARRHGLPVMVHTHGDEGARAAVRAGARSIEHGTYLSEETLREMRERGTWFVPTVITMLEMNEEQYDHVLRLRGSHMVPRLEQAVRDAHRIGVRLATGADNYYDNESINRISLEVMHLARLGLSPFEALQAATVSAAELLGIDDRTGRIEPGYEADLVVVPGNPLEDVRVLQDPLVVVSNGQVALKRIPFGLADDRP